VVRFARISSGECDDGGVFGTTDANGGRGETTTDQFRSVDFGTVRTKKKRRARKRGAI